MWRCSAASEGQSAVFSYGAKDACCRRRTLIPVILGSGLAQEAKPSRSREVRDKRTPLCGSKEDTETVSAFLNSCPPCLRLKLNIFVKCVQTHIHRAAVMRL